MLRGETDNRVIDPEVGDLQLLPPVEEQVRRL